MLLTISGVVAGCIATWAFFQWFDRTWEKKRSTEGRSYQHVGEFRFGHPRGDEPSHGGALDGCYTRKDRNKLVVRIDEGVYLLDWAHGDDEVALGRFDDEVDARAWFDWCKEQIGTGRLRLAGRRGPQAELGRRSVPLIGREVSFHRDAQGRFELTWNERGVPRLRLFLQHEPEGQGLLDLLATGARHPVGQMC